MKASIVEMMNYMLRDDIEDPQQTLNYIISNKYRKFISLYWLLNEYSEYITRLSYKETKHDSLKIKIKIMNIEKEAFIEKLIKKAEELRLLQIEFIDDSGLIEVIIYRDETELP